MDTHYLTQWLAAMIDGYRFNMYGPAVICLWVITAVAFAWMLVAGSIWRKR